MGRSAQSQEWTCRNELNVSFALQSRPPFAARQCLSSAFWSLLLSTQSSRPPRKISIPITDVKFAKLSVWLNRKMCSVRIYTLSVDDWPPPVIQCPLDSRDRSLDLDTSPWVGERQQRDLTEEEGPADGVLQ